MDVIVSNPAGKWFFNTTSYQFHDPESNTLFPSGVFVKALPTGWLKNVPMIEERPDPLAVEAPKESSKVKK